MSGPTLYTYVWNNPTNDTDPTGFEAESDDSGGGSGDGGGSMGMQIAGLGSGDSFAYSTPANFSANQGAVTQLAGNAGAAADADVQRIDISGSGGNPDTICRGDGCKAFLDKIRQQIEILKNRAARQYCAGSADGLCSTRIKNAISNQLSSQSGRGATILTDAQGAPVIGGNGQPVLVPDGINLGKFAAAARNLNAQDLDPIIGDGASGTALAYALELAQFRRGGAWDLQRLDGGFDSRFIDVATIAIGMYAAASQMKIEDILSIQNHEAGTYKPGTVMDSIYKNLPERNVINTLIGYDLINSGRF